MCQICILCEICEGLYFYLLRHFYYSNSSSLDPKNQFRILSYIHTFEALHCKEYLEFAFNLVFSCILLYILQKMENAKIVHSIKPLQTFRKYKWCIGCDYMFVCLLSSYVFICLVFTCPAMCFSVYFCLRILQCLYIYILCVSQLCFYMYGKLSMCLCFQCSIQVSVWLFVYFFHLVF